MSRVFFWGGAELKSNKAVAKKKQQALISCPAMENFSDCFVPSIFFQFWNKTTKFSSALRYRFLSLVSDFSGTLGVFLMFFLFIWEVFVYDSTYLVYTYLDTYHFFQLRIEDLYLVFSGGVVMILWRDRIRVMSILNKKKVYLYRVQRMAHMWRGNEQETSPPTLQ